MIKPEDIAVGSIVRLASGSPKMAVSRLTVAYEADVILWADGIGFVEKTIPLALLVWPRNMESDA